MEVQIYATPEWIADIFCSYDSEQQARFFNRISEVASKWGRPFEFQLQSITDEDGLTLGGRRVMQGIGEYSHWGLVPTKWKLKQHGLVADTAEGKEAQELPNASSD